MPAVTQPAHKKGDFFVDYEEKVFEDVKAKPGEKALVTFHTVAFEGMTPEESKPMIDWLQAHATRPEFTCRVQWKPGTITIWDNRRTMHNAINDYHGMRRHMRRLTSGPTNPA